VISISKRSLRRSLAAPTSRIEAHDASKSISNVNIEPM
jgi:hypothetical protein